MNHPVPSAPSSKAAAAGSQYLSFRVEAEEYGVELLTVQEIRAFSSLTPLPGSPSHVKGVINLRGAIVPVIGLRERFGLATVEYDRTTVIVVLHVGTRVVGVIVDAVCDVLTLQPSDIAPTPKVGLDDCTFLKGLGMVKERLITLLASDALVADVIGLDTSSVEVVGA
jgi:purine-binding chemotaxis protein CheW